MNTNRKTESTYDVIIVGGGIQGAGVAQAVQAAGYNSLVLEKFHLAAGTSSKSSKLIHGGLRYIKSRDFSLVKESLRERRLLLKNAPDLIYSNQFYIPVYKHSCYRPWQIRFALIAYWFLSGCCPDGKFKTVAKHHWSELKGLNTDNLVKVFCYSDAQTDDVKLTEAVMKSAISIGAEISCPAKLISAKQTNGGYHIDYEESGTIKSTFCRFLVNAGGPWVNQIANCISPLPNTIPISMVQGAHVVLDTKISDECFYLESPTDGRAVFVLPWKDGTLLGTTETLHEGDPEDAAITEQERKYLLDVLNTHFPDYTGKICGDMAGLRVLPQNSEKQNYQNLSREVQLITDNNRPPHYLAIYGGKLTGYRATASKVVKIISSTLYKRTPRGNTKTLLLTESRLTERTLTEQALAENSQPEGVNIS